MDKEVSDMKLSKEQKKELLISSREFAAEVRWKSWWVFLSTTTLLAGLLTVAALELHFAIRLLATLVAGLLVVRLFVIYHDYQHGAILKNSLTAKVLFEIVGFLMLSPRSTWKESHDYHHKHNSKIYGDSHGTFPVMTTEEYAKAGWLTRLGYSINRHPITLALGYISVFFWGITLQSFIKSPSKHWDCLLAVLFHIGLVTFLAMTNWLVLLMAFIIPFAIGAALGSYLFYAQHNFPEVEFRTEEEWDYTDAALLSSGFMKMSKVMHWFTANIGYHHVHHLHSLIPFYRLPEAMNGIEELQSPKTTTLSPLNVFKCLRLKLWCPEQSKMVGRLSRRKRKAIAALSAGS